MTQALLITLREGLEIAIVVVIVLAYLKRTGRAHLFGRVWQGVGLAVLASVAAGAVLFGLGTGLEGRAEEVFEGTAMLLAVAVLSWMIIWMKGQARHIRGELEARVEHAVTRGSELALAALAFLAVGREGLETALFLFGASRTATPLETTLGGVLGPAIALALGRMLYQGSHRVNLRAFFNITGVLLILFAAGLLARGVHEFQEAGLLPVIVEHVWDTNNLLNEDSVLGSLLEGLFGYNGDPSLLEVVIYPIYLALALLFFVQPSRAVSGPRRPATTG